MIRNTLLSHVRRHGAPRTRRVSATALSFSGPYGVLRTRRANASLGASALSLSGQFGNRFFSELNGQGRKGLDRNKFTHKVKVIMPDLDVRGTQLLRSSAFSSH